MPDQETAGYDPERVIESLGQQLGTAAGQIARLEAALAAALAKLNAASRDSEFRGREGGAPQPEPATSGGAS